MAGAWRYDDMRPGARVRGPVRVDLAGRAEAVTLALVSKPAFRELVGAPAVFRTGTGSVACCSHPEIWG